MNEDRIDLYPTLSMHVGQSSLQHWFYLDARDYFIYDRYYKACLLTILEEPNGSAFSDMWLMGDPFLRKYYSIYDMEEKRIGLVGVANSTRMQFEENFETIEDVTDYIEESLKGFLDSLGIESDGIVFQLIAAIVGSILMMCCCWSCQRCYYRCCKKKPEQPEAAQAPQ